MSIELRRDHCMRCGFQYDACECVVPVEPGLLRVKPNGWNIADWHEANRTGWKQNAYSKLWRDGAVLGGAAGLQIAALLDAIEPFVERELERRLAQREVTETTVTTPIAAPEPEDEHVKLVAALDGKPGCPVDDWLDGVYKVRCGFGEWRCWKHGPFETRPADPRGVAAPPEADQMKDRKLIEEETERG